MEAGGVGALSAGKTKAQRSVLNQIGLVSGITIKKRIRPQSPLKPGTPPLFTISENGGREWPNRRGQDN